MSDNNDKKNNEQLAENEGWGCIGCKKRIDASYFNDAMYIAHQVNFELPVMVECPHCHINAPLHTFKRE